MATSRHSVACASCRRHGGGRQQGHRQHLVDPEQQRTALHLGEADEGQVPNQGTPEAPVEDVEVDREVGQEERGDPGIEQERRLHHAADPRLAAVEPPQPPQTTCVHLPPAHQRKAFVHEELDPVRDGLQAAEGDDALHRGREHVVERLPDRGLLDDLEGSGGNAAPHRHEQARRHHDGELHKDRQEQEGHEG
jgi:hypothetical protein